MEYFTKEDSIVRQIWGSSDCIMFIFAGAAAEFALNKSVDWLYFTNKLPSDPLARFFSTVTYARKIVFAERQSASEAINTIAKIHAAVEAKRGMPISDWAYRDVLFMLIGYSINSFELLERKLTEGEKEEVFNVFYKVGHGMGINGLPENFTAWSIMRKEQLQQNLEYSCYTYDLFRQYRKHLGVIRYTLLLESQKLVIPKIVGKQLGFWNLKILKPFIGMYKLFKSLKLDWLLKEILLPASHKKAIKELDMTDNNIRKCPFHKIVKPKGTPIINY